MTDLLVTLLFPFRLFDKEEYNRSNEAVFMSYKYAVIIFSVTCALGVLTVIGGGLLFKSFLLGILISEFPFALSVIAGFDVAKGTNSKADASLVVDKVKKSALHWWVLVMLSIYISSLNAGLLFVFVGVVIATVSVTLNSIRVIKVAT